MAKYFCLNLIRIDLTRDSSNITVWSYPHPLLNLTPVSSRCLFSFHVMLILSREHAYRCHAHFSLLPNSQCYLHAEVMTGTLTSIINCNHGPGQYAHEVDYVHTPQLKWKKKQKTYCFIATSLYFFHLSISFLSMYLLISFLRRCFP